MGAATNAGKGSSGWWKAVLLALGAVGAAVVAWGAVSPEPERTKPQVPERREGRTLAVAPPVAEEASPAWVKPTIGWTIAVIVGVGVAFWLLGVLQ